MKKFMKFASIGLIVALLLGCLSGCSQSQTNDETAQNETADSENTGNTANSENNNSSSDGEKTLIIGGIGPLTGNNANYGNSVRNGAQIAVDEINAAGGVNGFQFVLDFQDSQGDPDAAVAAYGKLMDNGMEVSLGGTLSGETQSIVAASQQDGILVLTPTASSEASISGGDNAFRVCFNDPGQGTASATYIADNNLATKVAVFYASDNDYSVGLYETFKEEAANRGIEIVEEQTFTTSTSTDFSTQINAIKASGADLVFLPIYAAEAATFLTQANGKLDGMTFFGCDGLDGILTKVSDTSYVEGVLMLTPFAANDPAENVQSFVSQYEEQHNTTPDQFAADGYDAIYAIKAALEQTGITEVDDTFNEKMIAAMTEITVDGVTGSMTWTSDGEANKQAKVMIIRDGVAEIYEG